MSIIYAFIHLIRIKQWTKNIFLFVPLFFSGHFFDQELLQRTVFGFFIFSIAASSIYILNDLHDVENDKKHPIKRNRPIANGTIGKGTARILLVILLVGALVGSYFIHALFSQTLLVYLSMNFLYTFWLKKHSIVDVFIVAFGFILRIVAGGNLGKVEITHWLYLLTFLLALFLVVSKRRDDLTHEKESDISLREVNAFYTVEYLNIVISIMVSVLTMSYIMYVTSPEVISRYSNKPVFVSSLFVLAGLMRYVQISVVEKKSDSPTRILLTDRFTQFSLLAWILFFVYIIYLP